MKEYSGMIVATKEKKTTKVSLSFQLYNSMISVIYTYISATKVYYSTRVILSEVVTLLARQQPFYRLDSFNKESLSLICRNRFVCVCVCGFYVSVCVYYIVICEEEKSNGKSRILPDGSNSQQKYTQFTIGSEHDINIKVIQCFVYCSSYH